MDVVNYIPYFTDVEDAFIRLREKSLFLSPTDWALIASWQERGIPLHVVLLSIEEVFENHKSKARRRGINSLRYCQSEVESQFAEYCSRMVGKNTFGDSGKTSDANPFSEENVVAHLEKMSATLIERDRQARAHNDFGFAYRLEAAIAALGGVTAVFKEFGDVRKTEDELTKIDEQLDSAIGAAATPDQATKAREVVTSQLQPYKSVMPADVYDRQFEILLNKHLREISAVPRLSLFHLKRR